MRYLSRIAMLALMFAAGTVLAGTPDSRPVRDRIEASMLVTGMVDIDPDGSVSSWKLDQLEKLPPAVTELLAGTIPGWRFKPILIDGEPAAVRARTSIRIQARKLDGDNFLVEVAGAHFGSHKDADVPTYRRLTSPHYPTELAKAGAGGTVYLLVKIARDGSVEDAIAEQVNLKTIASDPQMRRMRGRFEAAAIYAARRWTFNPPVTPDDAPYWLVRVPVDFIAPGLRESGYGEWSAYIPGERRTNPWVQEDDRVSPDMLAAGGVYPVGLRGPELLTPLDVPQG
ncbi:energy transducer TonB [Marilutibacter maris]|nr:energy transducer TonB [Lysobacter maris]